MTASRTRKPPPSPAESQTSWAESLLAQAEVADRPSDKHRPTVDVPPAIVAFAQARLSDRKVSTFPVTGADQFAEQKLLWQSAGDLTTPPCSATVKEVLAAAKYDNGDIRYEPKTDDDGNAITDDDGNPVPDTDNPVMVVTHLRVTFGPRRGSNKPKTDKPAPPTSGDADTKDTANA